MEPFSRFISHTFFFNEDLLISLVLPWLDVPSLLLVDYTVTCSDRNSADWKKSSPWLRCLRSCQSIRSLANVEYNHQWIQWLIRRGVTTSNIHISEHFRCRIMDGTFEGIDLQSLSAIDLGGCFNITDIGVRTIAVGCPHLEHIRLSFCSQVTDAALLSIGVECTSLSSIDLSSCVLITDIGIVSLSLRCSRLKSINIQLCWRLTNVSLVALGRGCHELSTMVLKYNKQITDVGIAAIAEGCCQLRKVVITDCVNVTRSAIASLGEGCPSITSLVIAKTQMAAMDRQRMIESLSQLEHLSIEEGSGFSSARNKDLRLLGQHCKLLKSIRIDSNHCVGRNGLVALARGCPLLELISLNRMCLPREAILAIVTNCPALMDISARSLHDDDVTIIAAGLPRLKAITLIDCWDMTTVALSAIGLNCRELKTIVLKCAVHITDASIAALCEGCTALESMDLEHCSLLTDKAIASIAQHCHGLTYIDISCTEVTDVGISALTLGCPLLQSIFLYGCTSLKKGSFSAIGSRCLALRALGVSDVDDACVTALTQRCLPVQPHRINDWLTLGEYRCHCHGLLKVNMKHCLALTNRGVEAVVRGCPYLKSVDFSGCSRLTDGAMIALGLYCHGLTDVAANSIWRITDYGILALAEGCPDLQVLSLCGTVCADSTLSALALHCPGLRVLSVEGSCIVSVEGITALARGCHRLEAVNVMTSCTLMENTASLLEEQFESLIVNARPICMDYAHMSKLPPFVLAGLANPFLLQHSSEYDSQSD